MELGDTAQLIDMEPGWKAVSALDRVQSREVRAIRQRASFRSISDTDWVPVAPCPHCLDGGLRVAGTVRARRGCRLVRICDTCAAVELSAFGTGSETDAGDA
jgi:hypothetical protein